MIDTVAMIALEYPPAKAARHLLDLLSARDTAPLPEQRQAAVAAVNAMVQAAAADREPAELAEFVGLLSGQGEAGRAARALDVAAATREPGDLAKLAIGLGHADRPGERDLAGTLLAAVLRRRLPGDVAAAARALDGQLTGRLLAGLAEAGRVPDALHVVLALRACGDDYLAAELTAAMAGRLSPAGVAELVRGLAAHEEHAAAWDAIGAALDRDVRQVAGIVTALRAADEVLADAVLEAAALGAEPADRVVLAALAAAGRDPGAAAGAWAVCTGDLDPASLVGAFAALFRQAGPAAVSDSLAEAVAALGVPAIAELARAARDWVGLAGLAQAFRALAAQRPVAEAAELAGHLLDQGERDLAWLVLDAAVEVVPVCGGPGDAAELIAVLTEQDSGEPRRARLRRDPWRWRDRIGEIITGVAAQCRPELVMGLIDGLVTQSGYDEYARAIRAAVVRHLDAAQLAGLPQAGPRPHLAAVTQIYKQAVVNQDRVPPRAVPPLVEALRAAGADAAQLSGLLEHIGSHPYLDTSAIIAALSRAGLDADAAAVRAARGRGPR